MPGLRGGGTERVVSLIKGLAWLRQKSKNFYKRRDSDEKI